MLITTFLEKCSTISPPEILKLLKSETRPKNGAIWKIENEIIAADLYGYLYTKFGPPNGIQNFLRRNSSDNLIHWDWTLSYKENLIIIQGLNYRTEVHLIGTFTLSESSREGFIKIIGSDIKNYRKEIIKFQKETLEDWDIFVNPYDQLRKTIDQLFLNFDKLELDPNKERLPNATSREGFLHFTQEFEKMKDRYDQGSGFAMSLKIMIPILAESFINMLIFILCRDEIRNSERLFNAFIKENIDIRVQSLHLKCVGFKEAVKWDSVQCQKYHSIVNQRNDLLHGNIAIETRKFSETFFHGNIPVFKRYETMWQQSIGVSIKTSGVDDVRANYEVVQEFVKHVLTCLNPMLYPFV
jgi:hypothetical protein